MPIRFAADIGTCLAGRAFGGVAALPPDRLRVRRPENGEIDHASVVGLERVGVVVQALPTDRS